MLSLSILVLLSTTAHAQTAAPTTLDFACLPERGVMICDEQDNDGDTEIDEGPTGDEIAAAAAAMVEESSCANKSTTTDYELALQAGVAIITYYRDTGVLGTFVSLDGANTLCYMADARGAAWDRDTSTLRSAHAQVNLAPLRAGVKTSIRLLYGGADGRGTESRPAIGTVMSDIDAAQAMLYAGTDGRGTKDRPADGTIMARLNQTVSRAAYEGTMKELYAGPSGKGTLQNPAEGTVLDVLATNDQELHDLVLGPDGSIDAPAEDSVLGRFNAIEAAMKAHTGNHPVIGGGFSAIGSLQSEVDLDLVSRGIGFGGACFTGGGGLTVGEHFQVDVLAGRACLVYDSIDGNTVPGYDLRAGPVGRWNLGGKKIANRAAAIHAGFAYVVSGSQSGVTQNLVTDSGWAPHAGLDIQAWEDMWVDLDLQRTMSRTSVTPASTGVEQMYDGTNWVLAIGATWTTPRFF